MAMVETPDRIMTTGGDWGGGGSIWLILFAFLFMFRGHGGYGDGHGGHHGHDDYNNYKRYDADFRELRRDDWELQKEGLIGRYESRLQNMECCCKTNANISDVRAEVAKQGEETRCLMLNLKKDEEIERLKAALAERDFKINRDETIAGVLHGIRHGHYAGCGVPYGFVPAPAGYRYEGYSSGHPQHEYRGGCPGGRDD